MRPTQRTSSRAPGARALIASLVALCLLVPAAPAGAASGTGISSSEENELQRFALSLVNCARTGGYVTASGRCDRHPAKRYRSRYRKPLKLSETISERVAEPLAAKCRRLGRCGHHLTASYRTRFRRVGIRTRHVGEALGWGGQSARQSIIGSFRVMQREKLHPSPTWGRWHWRYIKDPDFRRVGIGIARRGSRTYIVYDFAR
jgi:hypothetical protein